MEEMLASLRGSDFLVELGGLSIVMILALGVYFVAK